MESFIAVIHILVALVLISLVLLQDTKSGSIGGAFGGGGSNSVLGATGATTLAQQMTRWVAFVFAITCVMLSIFSSRSTSSVLDGANAAAPMAPVSAPATTAPAETTTAPAAAAPAAPATAPEAGK